MGPLSSATHAQPQASSALGAPAPPCLSHRCLSVPNWKLIKSWRQAPWGGSVASSTGTMQGCHLSNRTRGPLSVCFNKPNSPQIYPTRGVWKMQKKGFSKHR